MDCFAFLFGVAAGLILASVIARSRRQPGTRAELGLHVSEVWRPGGDMANIERPPLNLLDSEGTTISIKGQDKGGEPIPEDQFAWEIDNPAVATLETSRVDKQSGETVTAPPYSRFIVNTHPGTAMIKVTDAARDRSETMPLNVAFSEPEEMGLSAGSPFQE